MLSFGQVTLPTDAGMDEKLLEIRQLWGADAIRNSDGTALSEAVSKRFDKIYSTYLTTRADLSWGVEHPEEMSQIYLMSAFHTAVSEKLSIRLLDGYYEEQVRINALEDPYKYWEVMDRTECAPLSPDQWEYDLEAGTVTIRSKPWHSYTVTFLAFQIWDAVCMYNHLTNDWGDKPHDMPYDIYNPATEAHLLQWFENWLRANPQTHVVRFTTFFYQFTLVYDDLKREKIVEWFGYSGSVHPRLLDDFEAERGYRLRPEHIVRQGYHNGTFCLPTPEFREYADFVQRSVARRAKAFVDMAHSHGKEAMMFFGDHWIGTEPYGKYWQSIGLDAIVGSVGSAVTCRMIADVPGVKYTEGRFLPYFFPDVFREGGDPISEANANWIAARRAICRKPLDRIGYGGYLSLAAKFPDFVTRVGEICDEFRDIYSKINGSQPWVAPFKVAILNAWGELRRWQTTMVAHAKPYKQTIPYDGITEALCGQPFDVVFLSFDDIISRGVPEDVRVIVNYGDADTAWSGGDYWKDPTLLGQIRSFVHKGGGFVGIGEPTATDHQGRFFQLADVLGVDKERGFTLIYTKYNDPSPEPHFVTERAKSHLSFCGCTDNVYATTASNLVVENGCTKVAANQYGQGRGVYIAGLPYNAWNAHLLTRALYWAASREQELEDSWHSENIHTECHAYPDSGWYCVLNNSAEPQETTVRASGGKPESISLKPMEIQWRAI